MICFTVLFSNNNIKKSYTISNGTATFSVSNRDLLQRYVSSTAKHYLYKNEYTDYDQYAMDDSSTSVSQSTFYFRSFDTEPEQLSKTNEVNFDCSSFITNVYTNAFGYNFGDYYKYANAYYFNPNYSFLSLSSSINYFNDGVKYTGRGVSTSMLEKVVDSKFSSTSKGTIYHGNATTGLVPFYYRLTTSETSSKRSSVYKDFESTLQNGDVFLIRYDNSTGHIMIYVNDYINSSGKKVSGFIHSTGKSYSFTNPSTSSDDEYSVDFMPYSEFKTKYVSSKGYLFATRSGKTPSKIALLRPINEIMQQKYTNFYTQTRGSLRTNPNTLARESIPNLRAEEYASVKVGSTYKDIGKYHSVSVGEEVKYTLKLKSQPSSGYTVSVYDRLPSNVSFVSCSGSCTYSSSTNEVRWYNVNVTTSQKTLDYTVRINSGTSDNKMDHAGMKITYGGQTLTMGNISFGLYPTYRTEEGTKLISAISTMEGKIKSGYLQIASKDTDTNSYRTKYSMISSSNKVTMSKITALKSLYYNAYDLDVGAIASYADNKAFVALSSSNGYGRKTTGSDNVNLMLVDGLYGGRKVRGNADYKRTSLVTLNDLEIGDIIIPGNAPSNIYIYLGKNSSGLHEIYGVYSGSLQKKSGTSATDLFLKLFTYDTFVILRPSKAYTSKIEFDYNGGTATSSTKTNELVTIGSTYGTLPDANKSVTVYFDYQGATSGNTVTKLTSQNKLSGWYLGSKKITSTSIVENQKYQLLRADYNNDRFVLPTPSKTGYSFIGWYTSASGGNRIGNGGDSVIINDSATLYARYEKIGESTDTKITSNIYAINQTTNEIVFRVEYSAYSKFISNLQVNSKNTIKIFNANNTTITSGVIPTGSKVRVYSGNSVVREYTNILIGDVTGDGKLSLPDIMQLARYVYKDKTVLKNAYLKAADYDRNSNYNLTDIMQLANRIYK